MKPEIEKLIDEFSSKCTFGGNLKIEPEYTLVARLDEASTVKISSFIDELKDLDPHQYYYLPQNLHLTIFGNIPISQENADQLKQIIENYPNEFKFHLQGIGSSTIIAEPINFSLLDLRQKIDKELKINKLNTLSPEKQANGWINFIRYKTEPKEALIRYLEASRGKDFGDITTGALELHQINNKIIDVNQDIIWRIKK